MNIKFFDLARKISKLSNHRYHKIGSVIVRGSRIVSVGTNHIKTHPRSPHPFKSLHAEMAAILFAKQDLRNCDLYVFRETKNGNLAKSFPCIYCQTMIKNSKIKNIYCTVTNNYAKTSVGKL